MHDVWIEPQSEASVSPLWLTSSRVRKGIRAMLQQDCCLVERRRLGREAENLLRMFKRELLAVQIAIRSPESECQLHVRRPLLTAGTVDSHLLFFLQRRYESLLALQFRWENPLIADFRWASHIHDASHVAATLTQTLQDRSYIFIPQTINPQTIVSDTDSDDNSSSEVEIVDENLLDIMEDSDGGPEGNDGDSLIPPRFEQRSLQIIESDGLEVIFHFHNSFYY